MATTAAPTRTVSDDMARLFESRNLVSPVVNNKRRIFTATTTPPKRRKLSTSSPDTVTSDSFTATLIAEEADFVEVPAVLESAETYAYLGFDDATAKHVWARYSKYIQDADPDDTEGEFMDFARWQIENVKFPDPTSEEDDWLGYMRTIGISQELQEAITLPEFSDLRYTASCQFWLLDTMEMRYESLQSLDDRLRAKAARFKGVQKLSDCSAEFVARTPSLAAPYVPKRDTDDKFSRIPVEGTGSATPLFGQPSPTHPRHDDPVRPAVGPFHQGEPFKNKSLQPSFSSSSSLTKDNFAKLRTPSLQDEEASPEQAIDTVAAPASISGCTMLWRSGPRIKAEAFYNPQTKEIWMGAIGSFPGDFNGERKVVYWTPQKETANRYAAWAKKKSPVSELCMVQVAVPEPFTASISKKFLWFDERQQPTDEWKKLIWHSRRGRQFPEELDYLYQKDLLIGHIASGKNVKYERMSSHAEIRDHDLLTVAVGDEERRAVQWVFNTAAAVRGFTEHCRDSIWLHSLGALKIPKQRKEDDDIF